VCRNRLCAKFSGRNGIPRDEQTQFPTRAGAFSSPGRNGLWISRNSRKTPSDIAKQRSPKRTCKTCSEASSLEPRSECQREIQCFPGGGWRASTRQRWLPKGSPQSVRRAEPRRRIAQSLLWGRAFRGVRTVPSPLLEHCVEYSKKFMGTHDRSGHLALPTRHTA
jgi:hypothetical protein